MKRIERHKAKARQSWILLKQLVITDFKLRYQGSVLGYAWSLLKPLFMFLVLYLIFAVLFKTGKNIPNYPIYLLLGVLLWGFFGELTSQGVTSLVERGDLIKKIRIPRWLIVVSVSFSATINFLLNSIVLIGFALFYGMEFMWSTIFIPFYVLEIYLFAIGVSFLLSALYVKYRDISYIWDVVLQAGFYATPILYPLSFITNDTVKQFVMVNPLAQAIQGARNVFVTRETETIGSVFGSSYAFFIPVAMIIVTLVVGILYFKKESGNFAEKL